MFYKLPHMEKKSLEQLENELAAVKKENELLQGVNAELVKEIEAGSHITADEPLPGLVSKESFQFEKNNYGFALPGVNHNGRIISISDVLKDKKLQAELVKMKSGMVTQIAE